MSEKAKTEALLTIVRTLQLNLKHGIAITEDDIAAMEQVGREALAASERTDLERLVDWVHEEQKYEFGGSGEAVLGRLEEYIADQFGVGEGDE